MHVVREPPVEVILPRARDPQGRLDGPELLERRGGEVRAEHRLGQREGVRLRHLEGRDLLRGPRRASGRAREETIDDRVAHLVLSEDRVDLVERGDPRRVRDVRDVGVVHARLDDVLELVPRPDRRVIDPRERRPDDRRASLRARAGDRLAGERRLQVVRRVRVAREPAAAAERQREPRDLLERKGDLRVHVEAAVGPLRQVLALVDVERRQRGREREVERAVADRRGAAEELDGRETLLDDRRRVEGLASLEPDVQRVGTDVLRQETAGEDLARAGQAEVALEVLEELLVRVAADREDAAEAERQVVRHVVEPQLPARLGLEHEDAEGPVRQRADPLVRRRRLGDRHADGRLLVAGDVALEDARRLGRGPPPRLLAEPDRAVGEGVELRREVGRPPRDPVVGQAEVSAAAIAPPDSGDEHARGAVLLRGPDEVWRVEDRHGAGAERDVLHARVVVQRDRRLPEREGPRRGRARRTR